MIGRREFITLLGGAATWPVAARAQQPPAKLPTIGYLGTTSVAVQSQWVSALVQRLRELGYVEGRTIAIEFRWADGRGDRLAEFAAEFVRLKVDVIVTMGTAVPPLKQATSVIPIARLAVSLWSSRLEASAILALAARRGPDNPGQPSEPSACGQSG
jgi:putative ABC transport system substrate-binding protein